VSFTEGPGDFRAGIDLSFASRTSPRAVPGRTS
jgi:hypothetical protein